MKVRFWGTRGSLPVALTAAQLRAKLVASLLAARGRADLDSRERIEAFVDHELPFELRGTYGGHSSCVQVEADGAPPLFLDFGSGARPLAGHYLRQFGGAPQTYHVFLSHLHWDHIMGFPFFTPVYIPGNRIVIHTCHANVADAFLRQQSAPCFPVDFAALGAEIRFEVLQPDQTYDIAGYRVRAIRQQHTGDSYGWRLERGGKALVYATDSEHDVGDVAEMRRVVDFFALADLVIFDAMYSLADAVSVKADWGHSSNIVGVELCQQARARRLCLFHHEPVHDDATLERNRLDTQRFEKLTRQDHPALDILSAYDGLEIEC